MLGPRSGVRSQKIAEELELDFEPIETGMNDDAIATRINFNRELAIAPDVLGIPAVVTRHRVAFASTDDGALVQSIKVFLTTKCFGSKLVPSWRPCASQSSMLSLFKAMLRQIMLDLRQATTSGGIPGIVAL